MTGTYRLKFGAIQNIFWIRLLFPVNRIVIKLKSRFSRLHPFQRFHFPMLVFSENHTRSPGQIPIRYCLHGVTPVKTLKEQKQD